MMNRARWRAASNSGRRAGSLTLLIACSALLTACGFHLRGSEALRLPPELATLRVQVADSRAAYHPLRLEMEEALRVYTRANVVVSDDVPVLRLSGEVAGSGVLSADPAGQSAERLLRYQLTFEVRDARDRPLAPPQTVRLQQAYTYSPLNVLSKEREERELRDVLRRDAIQQIVRRLTRVTVTPPGDAPAAD